MWVGPGDTLVLHVESVSDEASAVAVGAPQLVKRIDALSREDILANPKLVGAAKQKEIHGLHALGCFRRLPRSKSRNLVDTRWVLTWK